MATTAYRYTDGGPPVPTEPPEDDDDDLWDLRDATRGIDGQAWDVVSIKLHPAASPSPSIAGVPLFEIRVHFETDDEGELDRVVEAFERIICPHRADEPHRCPNRWNLMTSELDEQEAAALDELLNE